MAFVDCVELLELGSLLEFGDLDSIAGVAAGVSDADGGIIDMLNRKSWRCLLMKIHLPKTILT